MVAETSRPRVKAGGEDSSKEPMSSRTMRPEMAEEEHLHCARRGFRKNERVCGENEGEKRASGDQDRRKRRDQRER